MKDFSFFEAHPEQRETFGFEPSLFHRVDHLLLQSTTGWRWYFAKSERTGKVVASLYLNIRDGKANSAVRSPFGTIECSETISPETLYNFLQFVDEKLKRSNVTYVEIKCSPVAYAPNANTMILTFLSNLGYSIKLAEVTTCLAVDHDFVNALSKVKKYSLQRSKVMGLEFRILPLEWMETIYKFIEQAHQTKGYVLSMEYGKLHETANRFPEDFILSGIFENKSLVSASVAVKVDKNILYHFYVNHAASRSKISPVLMIHEGLYNYCKTNGMKLFDLGTSAFSGMPNFGLLSFKMRLGAIPSTKLTLEKFLP
ncbi:MAG: hypothetical protein ABIS36_07150 [Chryseolinea sp.]